MSALSGKVRLPVRLRPSIILLGDSLTEFGFGTLPPRPSVEARTSATPPKRTVDRNSYGIGWASLLSSTYSRYADVIVRGFSGYNTRMILGSNGAGGGPGGAAALPDVLANVFGTDASGRPVDVPFVTLWLGANDCAHPPTSPAQRDQHVPAGEYEQNVREVIRAIRSRASPPSGATFPIVLMTPPPVDERKWTDFCEATGRDVARRSNRASRAYGETLRGVAADLSDVYLLDIFKVLEGDDESDVGVCERGSGKAYSQYLLDGVHLNTDGNILVYAALMDLIETKFPQCLPIPPDEPWTSGKNAGNKSGTTEDINTTRKGLSMDEKPWTDLC